MNITDDLILRACYTWTGDSRPLQVEKEAMRKVLTEFAAALAAQSGARVPLPEPPDDGELEAWRKTADDLLRERNPHPDLLRRAAFLLQNAYLFGSKARDAIAAAGIALDDTEE